MATPWYATREQVQRSLDVAETARADAQIDQALASAVDSIHGDLHRVFYPTLATRTFDWPNHQRARAWRFWLEANELISASAVYSGGELLDPGDFLLSPVDGPPFTSLELNRATSAGWSTGPAAGQRSLSITGLFGYRNDEAPAGALAEPLDAAETDVQVSDGSLVGVGDLIRAGAERMVVTGRSWVASGQALLGDLAAQTNAVAIPVTDGSAFHAGEQITVDVERMLVVDVLGNTLSVKRAYRGSVLAGHTTAAGIYVDRVLTVERGALGTAAATHASAAPVVRWCPPAMIRSLALAEALVQFEQEKAGYGRTSGSGETERESRAPGLTALRQQAWTRFARQARISAI